MAIGATGGVLGTIGPALLVVAAVTVLLAVVLIYFLIALRYDRHPWAKSRTHRHRRRRHDKRQR